MDRPLVQLLNIAVVATACLRLLIQECLQLVDLLLSNHGWVQVHDPRDRLCAVRLCLTPIIVCKLVLR